MKQYETPTLKTVRYICDIITTSNQTVHDENATTFGDDFNEYGN